MTVEKELPKLYIQQPDGTTIMLGDVKEFTSNFVPDAAIDFITENKVIVPERTVTIEVRWNPPIDVIHLFAYGSIPTNNWRKLHGFPLRRNQNERI